MRIGFTPAKYTEFFDFTKTQTHKTSISLILIYMRTNIKVGKNKKERMTYKKLYTKIDCIRKEK